MFTREELIAIKFAIRQLSNREIAVSILEKIQEVLTDWRPLENFNVGRTLNCGEDLSLETMLALDEGEIFTLLAEDGVTPHSLFLQDFYGIWRERRLNDVCSEN